MIGHIQSASTPREAWDKLVAFDATNTRTKKMQLKDELNTIKKGSSSINDYTLRIKSICEQLASIGVTFVDDDKVESCLRGLTSSYKQFKTLIPTQENLLSFDDVIPMLIIEEKNLGEDASSSQGVGNSKQVFYSNRGRDRGLVQAKVEVMTVAIRAKVNNNSSKMIRRDQTHVEEDSIEAGGVKEVTGTSQEIMQEMKVQNVGIVEEHVSLNVIVHQGIRVTEDNKTIMCLPARI